MGQTLWRTDTLHQHAHHGPVDSGAAVPGTAAPVHALVQHKRHRTTAWQQWRRLRDQTAETTDSECTEQEEHTRPMACPEAPMTRLDVTTWSTAVLATMMKTTMS